MQNDTNKRLQGIEIVKLENDGLNVLPNLFKYAKEGFDSIEQTDFDRLKWYGLYVQRPKEEKKFMLRIKLPGGELHAAQALVLAKIGKDFGRNQIDITTRQAIQFHWITIQDVPEIFNRLAQVGLSSVEAAGDCPRNIVSSPLAGIDPDEAIDPRPLVEELNRFFEGNRDFSNLPRKFKIAITGSSHSSIQAAIHDVAFVPSIKESCGNKITGFSVLVGGGLSAKPALAKQLDVFIRPDQVLAVATGMAMLFRDYGSRESRQRARLKFLIADWGVDRFREELVKLVGPLETNTGAMNVIERTSIDHHKQKQPGLNYLTLPIMAGRLEAEDLAAIANLSLTYGDGKLRTTPSQDILIINVPDNKFSLLQKEQLTQRFTCAGPANNLSFVACTGKQFCPLAASYTRERISELLPSINKAVEISFPISIHMSGCINSCGQNQIADIGLHGTVIKRHGQLIECFEVWLGGTASESAAMATKLTGTIPVVELSVVIVSLLKHVAKSRLDGESFRQTLLRLGILSFQELLDCMLDSSEIRVQSA